MGVVAVVESRALVVEFPSGARLRLAAGSSVLRRVAKGETAAFDPQRDRIERLVRGDLDPVEDFAIRFDALHLAERREASGFGSFLGGRIRLFPHQLHAAERATAADPVRWLLADEVGLGKTIEACLILNRLVLAGRVERCLVVAPDTLTVQWLGELWRKHHQVFVLLDDKRLADVAHDFGADFNPFDLHRRAVVSLETLAGQPHLTKQAVQAGIDLLVVDEAHRLRRPKGAAGNPAWRAVAPIAALGRHVVLLSAIPLEDDAHGFFSLLHLLRPEELPDSADFEARLARADPLPPCTSSTRRADIGGLPPRVSRPIDLAATSSAGRLALEKALREQPAANALLRRQKLDRIRRALASGAALRPVLAGDDGLKERADACDADDPRIAWLAENAPGWKQKGEKTLLFVAHQETLELLRTALTHRAQLASAAFHEQLSAARRDIEVAQFRQPAGPSLLVSTECGGEGRNFEFCHRLVLFDLPWSPAVVEQRIGRLDRIGRRIPVEIVFFRPPAGIGRDVAGIFETIGLFAEPLAGLEPEIAPVEAAIEAAALDPAGSLSEAQLHQILETARAAKTRIREAAYRELHRDPFRPDMADGILARVPSDLDALNEDVVVAMCERLGFHVESHERRRAFSIEFGAEALVDSLPGVPGGASYLGTFDRETAVADESLDFFAAGHPLVEGLLAFLEEAPIGRVSALCVALGNEPGLALLALYKDGPSFEAVVLDAKGRRRPEWAALLRQRPLRTRRLGPEVTADPEWPKTMRRLAKRLPPGRKPVALAGLVVGP